MPRHGTPRRRPDAPGFAPTTITEIARRYYACAVALARARGVPMSEDFLRQHRESISCGFIEAERAGVQLPPAVPLPPLTGPPAASAPGQAPAPEPTDLPTSDVREEVPEASPPSNGQVGEIICTMTPDPALETPTTNGHAPPLVIPQGAGLPCTGQRIDALKPAPLAMLISKTARLAHDQGEAWVPLLAALQVERVSRLERGRKPSRPEGDADGT